MAEGIGTFNVIHGRRLYSHATVSVPFAWRLVQTFPALSPVLL
jgi:hypothetical protein